MCLCVSRIAQTGRVHVQGLLACMTVREHEQKKERRRQDVAIKKQAAAVMHRFSCRVLSCFIFFVLMSMRSTRLCFFPVTVDASETRGALFSCGFEARVFSCLVSDN